MFLSSGNHLKNIENDVVVFAIGTAIHWYSCCNTGYPLVFKCEAVNWNPAISEYVTVQDANAKGVTHRNPAVSVQWRV